MSVSGPELVPEWSAANSSGLALLDAGKETVTRGLLYILSQGSLQNRKKMCEFFHTFFMGGQNPKCKKFTLFFSTLKASFIGKYVGTTIERPTVA